MSKKKHHNKKKRTPMTEQERQRSEEASRILRENREAVVGPRAIDNDIHAGLTTTHVSLAALGLSVLAFFFARYAASQHNALLVNVSGIAIMVLFPLGVVLWFVSRHQAKKLTAAARAPKVVVDDERSDGEDGDGEGGSAAGKKRA